MAAVRFRLASALESWTNNRPAFSILNGHVVELFLGGGNFLQQAALEDGAGGLGGVQVGIPADEIDIGLGLLQVVSDALGRFKYVEGIPGQRRLADLIAFLRKPRKNIGVAHIVVA